MADTSMRIELATVGATPASDRPDAGASAAAARPTRRERRFTPTGSGSVADLLPSPPGRGAGGEGLASRESETVLPDRRRWVHNRWIDFLTLGGGSLVVLGALAAFWLAPVTADALSGYDQAVFGATLFLFIGWTFINIHHYFIDNVIRRCDNPEARRYLFTASGRPASIGGRDGQTQTGGWHRRSTP